MERVELLLLLLMLILSLYSLRVESKAGLLAGKRQGGCSVDEKEALLNFKQNLSDPRLLLSNWDISEDCCAWKGVGCSNTIGHVIKLDLRWPHMEYYERVSFNVASLIPSLLRLQHLQYLRLNGFEFMHISIPQSIFSLTNLRYLDLSNSGCFEGINSYQLGNLTNLRHLDFSYSSCIDSIPSNIGNLINLRYLSFSYSGLSGAIPPHIGNLTNLQHLDLHLAYISASNLLWISRLSSLQYLDMSYMNLTLATNWLHEIKMLPNLSTLRLSLCKLQTLPNLLTYVNFSSTLKILDLSENQFSNFTIPSWISKMTNLIELDLHECQLYGKVPNNLLGDHCRLRTLDRSQNFTDGNISSMVLGQLPRCITRYELKYLDLSHNHLSGTLDLSQNFTDCTISSMVLGQLPQCITIYELNYLDLSYNHLSGTLQNWLEQFRSLKILYLQSNNFTGPILWSSLSLLCDLDILILSENNFTELIDDESASSCKEYNMTEMDISNNQLSGSIPESIGQMRHLSYLHLGNNRLSGSIPYSLGQLMSLFYLNLGANLLKDSLSDANFANLSQLHTLVLSNNNLDFNGTRFNWIPPFQVSTLHLSSCYIGPHFPIWLHTQKLISSLDISNGGISDMIPNWFWNISSPIDRLNMSHNAIRGNLPMLLNTPASIIDMGSNLLEGHLPRLMRFVDVALFYDNKFSSGIEYFLNANMSLTTLDLSDNHLSDEIPNSICQMPSIGFLDLSYNNLWGEIPNCQWNISTSMNLLFINFANNNLRGSIPQWMGNLYWLISLHMSNNSFQEDISFLKNCSKLVILDLGQNKFTGNIPLWIGDKLSSLKILCLRSNRFYGSIPSNLSKLKKLQILDLANNFLSGQLPRSFKFLKSMATPNKSLESIIPHKSIIPYEYNIDDEIIYRDITLPNNTFSDSLMIYIKGAERKFTTILSLMMSMDLSCNNLSGEVPIELMSLIGLISLNLSRNQFTGHIPINIGAMKSLENLDLSWNHFSGKIPKSIANLSELSYLNLSYNQLSGRIPIGTQLETFDKSSYYGNLNLCGNPLLKTCEGDEHDIHNSGSNSHDEDNNFDIFFGMVIGSIVGLWSVLGTLLFKRSWAIAYFQLFDNIIDNIYVFVIVKLNQWYT